MNVRFFFVFFIGSSSMAAVAHGQAAVAPAAATQLTIYNGDFAVARTTIDLDLKAGTTDVLTTQVTRALEPDSVILRDASGRNVFRVGEQNYDASVINQASLLKKFEGQTLDFKRNATENGQPQSPIKGRVIRAGGDNGTQPLIEIDGQMQFQLPGVPLFPAATDGLLLKPTLHWKIESAKAAHFAAELAYVTRQLSWEATYNVVAPEATDVTGIEKADLTGWVTIKNQSGTDFPLATIKLVAGDVAKTQELQSPQRVDQVFAKAAGLGQAVTQKAFDDFHLYDLHRTVSLSDGEIKQVQFLTAQGISLVRKYEYDGGSGNWGYYANGQFNSEQSFGLSDNHAVAVKQQFKNSEANHLGVPLPAGRIRIYRQDTDGQLEFVGEATIQHTASDEIVSLTTGNAFDVKGKRIQTDFHVDNPNHRSDETFSIKLTNQKQQEVQVQVIERMSRGQNWEITHKSGPFTKVDGSTVRFPVDVPAKGEATLTYTVHYSW